MVALFLFSKGMTGAMAPFSYLVNNKKMCCSIDKIIPAKVLNSKPQRHSQYGNLK